MWHLRKFHCFWERELKWMMGCAIRSHFGTESLIPRDAGDTPVEPFLFSWELLQPKGALPWAQPASNGWVPSRWGHRHQNPLIQFQGTLREDFIAPFLYGPVPFCSFYSSCS